MDGLGRGLLTFLCAELLMRVGFVVQGQGICKRAEKIKKEKKKTAHHFRTHLDCMCVSDFCFLLLFFLSKMYFELLTESLHIFVIYVCLFDHSLIYCLQTNWVECFFFS